MQNDQLSILSDWRFCKIDYASKAPRYSGWQQQPLTLAQVPQTGNIGVLTGPHSNGLLAVDFDGAFAWRYWAEHIRVPFNQINTVAWTSGRLARCQMAFNVPQELWTHITSIKISDPDFVETDELDEYGGKMKPEGIEFRWSGLQSVLPPSMHPLTKHEYEWVLQPDSATVQDVPFEVLEWIIDHLKPKQVISTEPLQADDKVTELVGVMEAVKKYYPALAYDDWLKVTFSCMTHIGVQQGAVVMSTYYPAIDRNDYTRIARSYTQSRHPPGIGSLIERVRRHDPAFMKRAMSQQELIKKEFGLNPSLKKYTF